MLADLYEGLTVAPQQRRLLGVFAHPDDEAFTCAGTLARLAAAGGHVQLICATRGEVGEISDPALATPETLGEVREAELREACRTLGIAPPLFLPYRDSGMADTAPNEDPRSLHQAELTKVTATVVEAIRRERPQILLTFDPYGGYGHPDHIKMHHAAVEAFAAAGDPERWPEQIAAGLPAHTPARLFYIAIPRSYFQRMSETLLAIGIDPAASGFRGNRLGTPDEAIDAIVDVRDEVDRKERAFLLHRTQIGPNSLFLRMPREMLREGMSREHFIWAGGRPDAAD